MTVGQSSTSELVYTSIEKQIEAARIQACQWGADAIVIVDSQGDKKTTWGAWSGLTYRDERESRIIAIRYIHAPAEQPNPVTQSERQSVSGLPVYLRDERSLINFRLDEPGFARVEIFDSNGRHIRVLLSEPSVAGYHHVVWDWRTENGIEVRDGQYTYNVYQDGALLASDHVWVKWSPD